MLFQVWSTDWQHLCHWEFVRNTNSQVSSQTYWVRISGGGILEVASGTIPLTSSPDTSYKNLALQFIRPVVLNFVAWVRITWRSCCTFWFPSPEITIPEMWVMLRNPISNRLPKTCLINAKITENWFPSFIGHDIIRKFAKHMGFWAPLQVFWIPKSRMGPRNLCFEQSPQLILIQGVRKSHFEQHCSQQQAL